MISDRLPYINTSDRTGTCDRKQLSNSFYANKMISDGLLHINPSDRLSYINPSHQVIVYHILTQLFYYYIVTPVIAY